MEELWISLLQYLRSMYSWTSFPIHQVQEGIEARQKFSNAKSISSAQFFGDENKARDTEAQVSLQKFSVCMHGLLL